MLLEFDSDQLLWQQTVREVVAKQCPPTLIREVADKGADPEGLWRTYAELGWTELTDPADAVELAIVLEELGRATDPTPYLATMTQFAPLAPDFVAEPKVFSLALRIARVAAGTLDLAFASSNSHDWDLAAADLLVHEAGGALTTFEGRPLIYNRADPLHGALVAAGRPRHEAFLALLHARAVAFA